MSKGLLPGVIPSVVLALCPCAFIRSMRVKKDIESRVSADEIALVGALAAIASDSADTASAPMLDSATGAIYIDGSDVVIGSGLPPRGVSSK